MPKLVYVGPGTGNKKKTVTVSDAEVVALEKTGLWKKQRQKAAESSEKKEKEVTKNG